jgi:hypothetical protein
VLAVEEETWVAIAALLVGYIGSLVTEAVRDRRQSAREDRARHEGRHDERDARQRETLLRLQEELQLLARTYGEMHYSDVRASRKAGRWTRGPLGDELNQRSMEAEATTSMLKVRIDDARTREFVDQLKNAGTLLTIARSEDDSRDAMDRAMAAFVAAMERIGELLRERYP